MVHERRIQGSGQTLDLKVSGQVRLGNLVMYDEATGSTWLQETGMSLGGTHQGKRMISLSADQWTGPVRWDEWKKKHTNSKVLYCEHCAGLQ